MALRTSRVWHALQGAASFSIVFQGYRRGLLNGGYSLKTFQVEKAEIMSLWHMRAA
jgi:hypothetical protein